MVAGGGATVSVTRRVPMRNHGIPVCDRIPSHRDPAMATQQKRRFYAVLWSALLAFLILLVGQTIWVSLLAANFKSSPRTMPWSVPAMAVVLWLLWQYLGGRWSPRSTSESRKRALRANPVSGSVLTGALLAGVLSIIALAGLWIVFVRLVKTPANALDDPSKYPLLTVALVVGMSSLVSPIVEEIASSITTDRERIFRSEKTRRSHERFSRRKWGPSWPFRRSVGCIIATNDELPERAQFHHATRCHLGNSCPYPLICVPVHPFIDSSRALCCLYKPSIGLRVKHLLWAQRSFREAHNVRGSIFTALCCAGRCRPCGPQYQLLQILNYLATLHHKQDIPHVRNIYCRVTLHRDDVGKLVCRYAPDLLR